MDPEEALRRLRERLDPMPPELRVEVDDWGHLLVFVRMDMLHLDADALNDRLHAWVARDVNPKLPTAEAQVEFRNAHPASSDEPELDVQSGWHDLEPSFRIDLNHKPSDEELDLFLNLVPAFLERVHGEGRPDGWRDVEMGATE